MGKYCDIKCRRANYQNRDRDILLKAIANELAEANRLKRLELGGKETRNYDGAIVDLYTDNELEDKA